jgi:hypothetical protein
VSPLPPFGFGNTNFEAMTPPSVTLIMSQCVCLTLEKAMC